MTLKTLEDMSMEEWKDRKEFVELWVRVDELKEEAIKHINYIRTHKPYIEWEMVEVVPEAKPLLKQVLTYEGKVLIEYLKYLFNISEEDLKGGNK